MTVNIVEFIAEDEDCACDQPCRFGHRVGGHAVYCHHDDWSEHPRKCRRTWYTGGKIKDEDCPGFQANPAFTGPLHPSPIAEPLCAFCKGRRIVRTEGPRVETCPRCCGDGTEPRTIPLSTYEVEVLEFGMSASNFGRSESQPFTVIAEDDTERAAIFRLIDQKLVQLRSCQCTNSGAWVYLLFSTGKGHAVLRHHWKTKKETR